MAEKNDNSVFIGSKPFMNYVTGIVIQFTAKNRNEVVVKARGKNIQKAVDVSQSVRSRFLRDRNIEIKNVKIGGEEVENKEGRKMNISTIEITLGKEKQQN